MKRIFIQQIQLKYCLNNKIENTLLKMLFNFILLVKAKSP